MSKKKPKGPSRWDIKQARARAAARRDAQQSVQWRGLVQAVGFVGRMGDGFLDTTDGIDRVPTALFASGTPGDRARKVFSTVWYTLALKLTEAAVSGGVFGISDEILNGTYGELAAELWEALCHDNCDLWHVKRDPAGHGFIAIHWTTSYDPASFETPVGPVNMIFALAELTVGSEVALQPGPMLGWLLPDKNGRSLFAALFAPSADEAVVLQQWAIAWSDRAIATSPEAPYMPSAAIRELLGLAPVNEERFLPAWLDPDAFADGTRPVADPHLEIFSRWPRLSWRRAPEHAAQWILQWVDYRRAYAANGYDAIMVRVRFCRELIAHARTSEDLAPVLQALEETRELAVNHHLIPMLCCPALPKTGLRKLLPTETLLKLLGVSPDGRLLGAEEEALGQMPLAVLDLPSAELREAGIAPSVAIAAGRRWAARHPQAPLVGRFEAAVEQLQVERRWIGLASLTVDSERFARISWTEIHHAATTLFPEPAREASLESLGAAAGTKLNRLVAILRSKRADHPEMRIGDVPATEGKLLALAGVGERTVDALARAVLRHLDHWRWRRAGLKPGALTPSAVAGRDDIASGLSDLEALFGQAD